MKNIIMWHSRWFKVISMHQANEWGLRHYRNIYGDEINRLSCRSLFVDTKMRVYRVDELWFGKCYGIFDWGGQGLKDVGLMGVYEEREEAEICAKGIGYVREIQMNTIYPEGV